MVKDGQPGMRLREINTDLFPFLKVKLKMVSLILRPVLVKYLLDLAGVILQVYKCCFHVLRNGEDSICVSRDCVGVPRVNEQTDERGEED
jgi:hypothetical protein